MESPLTPRQREIAALIARGYTNPEIAAELVLTSGTVANHIQHIFDKLGFHHRAQVAAWVAGGGLDPAKDGAAEPEESEIPSR